LERFCNVPRVDDEEVGREILRDDKCFVLSYMSAFLTYNTLRLCLRIWIKLTSAGTLIAHSSTFGLEAIASHSNGESVYFVSTLTGAIPLGG
jgi:hypothetical protein